MPPAQGPQQPVVDPFAFLNESKKHSFNPIGLFNGLEFRARVIALVGGGLVLIILIFGLSSVFGGNSGINMTSLYAVLGQQQELINLSTIGTQQTISSQSYLNFSATMLAAATTDNNKLIQLLGYNHIKVSPKNYVLQPQADAQLTQAVAVSNFDPVYAAVMLTQLRLYQNVLTNAYSLNTSPVVKSYLKTDYNDINLLLVMLRSSYD